MRSQFMTIGILAASLFGTAQAQAAASWSCDGPEYVCGSSRSASVASEGKIKRAPKAATADSDDQPARKRARKESIASTNYDGDAPVHRRTARTYDNDGGGSSFSGKASYYWEPQALASGGRFNPDAYTAAHKTLPFGTRVRVTNQHNGQSVDVVINDRGPYVAGRVIDLSKAAAHSINMQGSGVVPVSVRVLGRG